MQQDPTPGDLPGDELEAIDREDAKWQARVLALLLASADDGEQLSKLELSTELIGETPEWAEQDGLDRALSELERYGLIRRVEPLILPTRAARHFDRLEVE
jgi:hypothetical protein